MKIFGDPKRVKSETKISFYSNENLIQNRQNICCRMFILWTRASLELEHMMFRRFASSGGRARFGWLNKRGLVNTRDVSQFDVGGHKFTIQGSDLGKFPSSKLYQMTQSAEEEIKIDRSGALFQHIKAYMQYGHLPKDNSGQIVLEKQTLKELESEAEFYGLDGLSVECNLGLQNTTAPDFKSFVTIRDYAKGLLKEHEENHAGFIDFHVFSEFPLAHALQCLWVPFCLTGQLFKYINRQFELKLSDVVASPSPAALNISENCTIDASQLNPEMLDKIIHEVTNLDGLIVFAPHLELTLHPKELVIHQEGYAEDQSQVIRSSRTTSGHIGTLAVILDSAYTGSELEVTHGDYTEVVTGPYSWVAMYGDCLHKINPVTSGTRATLVFDIYGQTRDVNTDDKRTCNKWYERDNAPIARDLINPLRPPSDAQKDEILKCLDIEMSRRDSIVLGLQHQYHYNDLRQMPTVDMLVQSDKVLYDILTSSGEYDIKLHSFTVHEIHVEPYVCDGPTIQLFAPDSIQTFKPTVREKGTPSPSSPASPSAGSAGPTHDFTEDTETNDMDSESKNDEYDVPFDYDEKGEERDVPEPTVGVAVVLPSLINKEWILSDHIVGEKYDYTRESVYLVSGLQISKKKP